MDYSFKELIEKDFFLNTPIPGSQQKTTAVVKTEFIPGFAFNFGNPADITKLALLLIQFEYKGIHHNNIVFHFLGHFIYYLDYTTTENGEAVIDRLILDAYDRADKLVCAKPISILAHFKLPQLEELQKNLLRDNILLSLQKQNGLK